MPRYSPQSLPQRNPGAPRQPDNAQTGPVGNAIAVGRHVRQEQGMQGVRAYASAMRPFLAPHEHGELCQTFGISPQDVPPPPPPPQQDPPRQQQQQQQQQTAPPPHRGQGNMGGMGNMDQMAQMMQLFSQMNGMGGQGNQGGMNPMMLSQLMGMMNNMR